MQIVNTMMPKQRGAVRPVSAVYSYNDVSPVITGEFVREAGGIAHMSYTVVSTANSHTHTHTHTHTHATLSAHA